MNNARGDAHATTLAIGPCSQSPNHASESLRRCLSDGINSLPSGFALFDKDDHVVVVNSVFQEMLPTGAALLLSGATFPEMARHNALTRFNIGEESIEAWMERRLAYRDSPKGTFDQELSDGRWVRIQESRTTDGGTVTNWTDITDLKKQEQAINDYAIALANTNSELQEFAHVASHDLQEPLRKIEAFGSRLSESCADKLNEREARYLERMQDASTRMRTLVSDLLDYSRVQNSRGDFDPVDLNLVVVQALENLELAIEEKTARITFSHLPTIHGDSSQMARLFQNLLSNALKYCDDERCPEIHIAASTTQDERPVITVKDNGIGFEPEHASKIFNIFQRLHSRSKYQGTGIGLAACRKIVQGHGGDIRAHSVPGNGSTFTVTFPRHA